MPSFPLLLRPEPAKAEPLALDLTPPPPAAFVRFVPQTIGLFFVVLYLVCDSFTSQWQDRIFKKHKIDQYQMMFGVNCFSIVFTLFSLVSVNQIP